MAITATVRRVDARRESKASLASFQDGGSQQQQQPLHSTFACGACRFCADVCDDPGCSDCGNHVPRMERTLSGVSSDSGSACSRGSSSSSKTAEYTMCEVRHHNTLESCWLVAGDTVYDATTYVGRHPGGAQSILKKSGGAADCTVDIQFHSKAGQRMWKKYAIGRVKRCPSQGPPVEDKQWWMFW